MKCPHCGNYVEPTRVKSYSNKVTRQGVKTAVHGLTGVGATGIGAEIGTAILPGLGTVIGAAAGFIGSAMFNQKVNEKIDDAVDVFTDFELEYNCPKCGYSWTGDTVIDDTGEELIEEGDGEILDSVLRILNVIADTCGIYLSDIRPESHLENDLGIDILDNVQIIINLEREFNCKLKGDVDVDADKSDYIYVDDFIEELLGVSLFESLDDYLQDSESYSSNLEAINAILNKELPIKEMFEEMCSISVNTKTKILESKLAAYITALRVECFLELANGGFADYPEKEDQLMLQKELLIDGLADMETISVRHPNNDEYKYLLYAEKMLNAFWVESITDKSYYVNLGVELNNSLKHIDFKDYVFNDGFVEEEICKPVVDHIDQMFQKISGGNDSGRKETTVGSEQEQKYLEEVRATLEDGEIGPRERKALERHRVRLGISEERAEELESSLVTPSFSDDEIKYLEEVKFVLEDGEIGPRERKSLERHRVRLGISEERAKEIEAFAEKK